MAHLIAFAGVAAIALVAAAVFASSPLNVPEQSSTPLACQTSNFVNQVSEDATGALSYVCAVPSGAPVSEAASSPSACGAGSWLTRVTEDASGTLTFTCASLNQEAASSPTACASHTWLTQVTEDSSGVLTFTCTQPGYSDLSGTNAPTWTNIQSFPSACAAGEYVYGVGATLTCQDVVNAAFTSNANTCTDTTSGTAKMAGFGLTYTTGAANMEHDLVVTLDFQINSPATINLNTKYTLAYGSTTTPACNAAVTGTTVGNQYQLDSFGGTSATAFVETSHESVTVAILGLATSTTYWFDVQMLDSSAASWTYTLPQMTVSEN